MEVNKTILDKDGIAIKKITDEHFKISFTVKSKVDIKTIFNVNFIKLIYELNADIFNTLSAEPINESEQHMFLSCKDLFADLGIPQYYYNFSVKHIFNDLDNAASSLIITPIYINNRDNDTAMFIPLTYCDMTCTTVDNIGFFNIDIRINNTNLFKSSFFEKMVAMLFYKLINKLKHFINII